MPQSEKFEVLVLGSGTGGKLIAWYMAQSGRRTAVVERRWVGGSCPNIACMPSKNEISSAKVAHFAREGGDYGTVTGSVTGDPTPGGTTTVTYVGGSTLATVTNTQMGGRTDTSIIQPMVQ